MEREIEKEREREREREEDFGVPLNHSGATSWMVLWANTSRGLCLC